MKNVAPVRRELGIKTIFNILGPLTNPANAPHILMGVFHADLVGIQVRALERLGAQHALVVHGLDGMDEVSLGAATLVGELKDGVITEYEIHPEDFGLAMASNRALKVETAEASKTMLLGVLNNQPGPARDIVALNAGVALYAANVVPSMALGVQRALDVLDSGAARAKLDALIAFESEAAFFWSDPGTWIALGVSALFLGMAWAMHRVFTQILKAPPPPDTSSVLKDPPHEP
jgi:anthranilate phosphoribosyltransferase